MVERAQSAEQQMKGWLAQALGRREELEEVAAQGLREFEHAAARINDTITTRVFELENIVAGGLIEFERSADAISATITARLAELEKVSVGRIRDAEVTAEAVGTSFGSQIDEIEDVIREHVQVARQAVGQESERLLAQMAEMRAQLDDVSAAGTRSVEQAAATQAKLLAQIAQTTSSTQTRVLEQVVATTSATQTRAIGSAADSARAEFDRIVAERAARLDKVLHAVTEQERSIERRIAEFERRGAATMQAIEQLVSRIDREAGYNTERLQPVAEGARES